MNDTANADFSKSTVLLVDDIPVNIILLQTMLSRLDVNIVTANNGQAALDAIDKHNPQLVLLDIQAQSIFSGG